MCAYASGRELSAERTDNPWINWGTGQNGDGSVTLWDLGGIQPTLEDDIYYKANGTWFFNKNANDLLNNTIYAKSLTLISTGEAGYFNIDSGIGFIEVAEDVNLVTEKGFGFGDVGKVSVYQRITIGGNLNYDGKGDFKTVFVDNYNYSEDDVGMIVGGTVNFVQNGGRWKIEGNREEGKGGVMMYTWIQMGGLNGKELKLSTNETHAADFNIVFKSDGKKAFSGGEWTGAFTSYWSGGKTASITMDGGANGGLQTVRMLDSMIGSPDEAMTTQTLEMRSGKMALGNGSKTKFTQIDMNGGELYIVDAQGANDKGGSIIADVLNLNGGDLIFDVDNTGNDVIEVGTINGSGTNIIVNFDVDEFNIGDNVDGFNVDLFRGVSTADWAAISNCVKFMLGDTEVFVDGHTLINGNLALSGVISVPEPAAVAAVFGAFAIALAACRRRKS